METEPTNLNTEENDIAGNRIDGPAGNTAAKPGRPGAGAGLPGGPPAAATPSRTTPASSEALAAAETSMADGALDPHDGPRENQEANPAHLKPTAAYGGSFDNSTQGSFDDESRRENQDSNPNRGEFGAQDPDGSTHGGYGGQNRAADYEPRASPEDQYYGGPGAPGPQANAYRAYEGRDERPDPRTEYGFAVGAAPTPGASAPVLAANSNQNDNGARPGPDSGYANDYGHTSLRGEASNAAAAARPEAGQRNQTEDYLPTQGDTDAPSRQPDAQVDQNTNLAGTPGPRSADAEQPAPNERTGYVQAPGGDTAQGMGSRGGSYNDAYDDSRPGSTTGSPAKGDQRREDMAQNYGAAAREENRATDEENEADHGAPRRNTGRDD